MNNQTQSIIELENITVEFPIEKNIFGKVKKKIKALNNVSLTINKGEIFGLVGESGSGKSTTGKIIMNLLKPTDGQIKFDGKLLNEQNIKKYNLYKELQMIFQDPYASLNPKHTIRKIVEEPLIIHSNISKEERTERVENIIKIVGLNEQHLNRYPHEFSGGQRQRISIARALILQPKFIVADESVSALDVSIQAQILNLIKDLQQKFDITFLFISHDLGVVKHVSNRMAVMYFGEIVEQGITDKIIEEPLHPYTKALFSAIPSIDINERKEKIILQGDVPSMIDVGKGCAFCSRCPKKMEICEVKKPNFYETRTQHFVACHLYNDNKNEVDLHE